MLGDNLLGLQAGNEPDFYEQFGRRVAYSPQEYTREVGDLIRVMDANDNIPFKNMLIGPSVSTIVWSPEMVWETGFIELYKDRLYALSVEHYEHNNCAALKPPNPNDPVVNPQDVLPVYLTHDEAIGLMRPYLNSQALAQRANKPLIMFETNTTLCGGYAGVCVKF